MFPLDPMTVERLAEVIVDEGGAYERPSWKLPDLFRRAGWKDVPDFYGYRVTYICEQLTERAMNRSAVERVICRICDPLEYGDTTTAEAFRAVVNDILHHEGLVVSLIGGRPVIGSLAGSSGKASYSEPTDLHNRIGALIDDRNTVDLLVERAGEAVLAERNGAYTLAIIGIGSFIEGLLLSVLVQWDAEIRERGFTDSRGSRVRPQAASLSLLIDTAHEREYIQLDAKDFSQKVREFRNFVHPNAALRKKAAFDADSVMLCWAPVHAILNDLEAKLLAAAA